MIGCGHLTTFSPARPVPGGERAAARRGRCVLQRRRDFRTAVGIRAGLWLLCEIIVDIGAMHEMSIGLFSAAAALGAMGLMFALGLMLGALVCRLLRRKQLA